MNHQSKINTSDDPVGKGGNEAPASEGNILRRDLSGINCLFIAFPGNVLNCEQTQWKCVPLLLCTHMVRSVLLSKDPRAVVRSGSASFPGREKDDLQVTMQQNSRKKKKCHWLRETTGLWPWAAFAQTHRGCSLCSCFGFTASTSHGQGPAAKFKN